MFRFALPDIGEGVVEAEIVEWKVAVGDHVAQDQPLVVLLTDKAESEVPSPRAGRVQRLAFEPGQTARVGEDLIEIDEDGAAAAQPLEAAPETRPAPTVTSSAAAAAPVPPRMPRRPSRERGGAERGASG